LTILTGRLVYVCKSIFPRTYRDAGITNLDIRGKRLALESGWIGDEREISVYY
jgi:hypothetical protein